MRQEIIRNFLEINSLQNLNEVQKPNKCLNLIKSDDFQLNKFLYKQVGKKYNWIDRLSWSDQNWIDNTSKKNINTFVLKYKEDLVGYFELIFHEKKKEMEIAYLGILEEYFGKNYGSYLLSEAIKISFQNNCKRVWVHTCSLDHKNALKNYQKRGMKIFKSEKINFNL